MRVLVVEDDVKVAAAVRRGLEAEGFAVDVSHDGLDGLWRATELAYDLVVLDLMLPGRNGFQVCADLRAAGDLTPVLVLTAKDGEWDEVEALETGADDFLAKPFSFPVLVARLRALLRRPTSGGGAPFTAGDLRVDPAARRVWRDDIEVALTAREFEVLEHLVRRAGAAVTKEELLAAVWADDGDRDANLVEVYVRRLRRKVDEPFGRHSIETLRGAGYRLDVDGG